MSRVFKLALGVITAIGGFVDIGNLVTSGITGARFGMTLTWAIVVGTIGMTLYGEMAGRVSAVARRPVFTSCGSGSGCVPAWPTCSPSSCCPA